MSPKLKNQAENRRDESFARRTATKGKPCGPKTTKAVKRPAASSMGDMKERPAAKKKKGARPVARPPADPMPGAPEAGVFAFPTGNRIFDQYASEQPYSPEGSSPTYADSRILSPRGSTAYAHGQRIH